LRLRRGPRPVTPPFGRELPLLIAFLVAFPTALAIRTQLVVLFALVPIALLVHRVIDRPDRERRRLLSPLVLFTLAFVLALGPRAVLLASGSPGRFFVLDPVSGRTVSAFITAPQARRDHTFNAIRNPFVEGTTRDWGAPVSNGFAGTLARAADGYEGSASAEARVRTGRGGTYVGVAVAEPFEAKTHVSPGHIVAGSIAAKALERLPRGRLELEVIYYGAGERYIRDELLSGAGARPARADPAPGRWYRLYGTSRVPGGAAYANLYVVVHGLAPRRAYRFRLDAALLVPDAPSRTTFIAYGRSANEDTGMWKDAAERALSVSIAMLLAVFLGYLLPFGARLARRIPALELPGLADRRTRRLAVVLVAVGLVAYAAEMETYGGYGGYLSAFSKDPTGGLGKFYIRAVATLTTGVAVLLLTRRISVGRTERWRPLEVALIVTGFAIALSYWLKAMIVIPVLTVMLFWYFVRRRALVWLVLSTAGFAILTPFVYQVRAAGTIRLADFTQASYWSEFLTNLQSRFFHFESLMVVIPYADREPPWQPLLDFFGNVVPRALWHGKPLSANARFTHEYLQGGLHHSTDVGVISLPGEMWLTGGWLAVTIGGAALGVMLRLTQALIEDPAREPGTLLVAVTLLTMLVFANDGWGLASTVTSVLILAVGWLGPLRRAHRSEWIAPVGDLAAAEPVAKAWARR
jgi:hypothetical protein